MQQHIQHQKIKKNIPPNTLPTEMPAVSPAVSPVPAAKSDHVIKATIHSY